MKIIEIIGFFCLFTVGLLSSCSDGGFDQFIPQDPNYDLDTTYINSLLNRLETGGTRGLELGCIAIDYPLEFLQASGGTIRVDSEASFEDAMELEGPEQIINFVFPLPGRDVDGVPVSFDNIAELGQAFIACIPQTGWATALENGMTIPASFPLCYELVYPINLINEQGIGSVIYSELELIDLIAKDGPLFFALPFTVKAENGDELFLRNMDEFFTQMYKCEGVFPPVTEEGMVVPGFGCNKLLYPLAVKKADGTQLSLENADAYASLLLSGEELELSYPFIVENRQGGQSEVSGPEEMIEALIDCGSNIIIIDDQQGCSSIPAHILLYGNQGCERSLCGYTIDFPTQLTAEGLSYDINDLDEYYELYRRYKRQINAIEMTYPISITICENNSNRTFYTAEEVCVFLSDHCQ